MYWTLKILSECGELGQFNINFLEQRICITEDLSLYGTAEFRDHENALVFPGQAFPKIPVSRAPPALSLVMEFCQGFVDAVYTDQLR